MTQPAEPRMDAEMRAAIERLLLATENLLGDELPDAVADGINAVASAYLRPPPKYEAEVFQSPLGFWGFSLFCDGERVGGSAGLGFYVSGDAAIRGATREAQRHRGDPHPAHRRVTLDLPLQGGTCERPV